MLIDANELPEHSEIDCDICIAGSGPAGITIASELANTSTQVCLIESGSLDPLRAIQDSNVGEQLGVPVDLAVIRRHAFGGGSNWWGGRRGRWFRLKPMDPIDFAIRPWIANSGWPLEYDELARYFERASKLLNGSGDFDVDAYRDDLAPEFHNEELQTTIFQMSRPPRLGKDRRSLLARSPNMRVYFHGRIIEIEEDAHAPTVRYFHMATYSGRTHRIAAKYFVLACGGLENPRLLLASKRKSAAGIGNEHDLVGRYYMQHPRGLHGFAILRKKSLRSRLYTGRHLADEVRTCGAVNFSEKLQRKEKLLNHCVVFHPIFALSESHASEAYWAAYRTWHGCNGDSPGYREFLSFANFGLLVLRRAVRDFRLHTMFRVSNHMEQIPRPENRLDLSDRKDRFGVPQLRIDWRIDAREKASLCRLHELVQAKLTRQNAGSLESQLEALADAWPVERDSAHHLGTTRMHDSSKWGVTDPDGRVHSVRNLYVSGSSVFPTSGHANPTLTIVALALRLADHLKGLQARHVLHGRDRQRRATTLESAPT
jgi:choline dehydrogenase-like flavoprotein